MDKLYLELEKNKATFDVIIGTVISEPKVPFIHPKIGDETTYSLTIQSNGYID